MDQPVFPVRGDDAEAIPGYEQRLFRVEVLEFRRHGTRRRSGVYFPVA
ncbi:MAG: hypothetical protein L6W00_03625 [Lentisphaeria bacterium]|nr:MAG: hypothetical protein L6W00_03625 [Lentisphaeria bacterium]